MPFFTGFEYSPPWLSARYSAPLNVYGAFERIVPNLALAAGTVYEGIASIGYFKNFKKRVRDLCNVF